MNVAQLSGMRLVFDTFHGAKSNGYMVAVRTAQEMAVVPHTLSPMGQLADEPNGNRWGWSDHLSAWVLYEVKEESKHAQQAI